MRENEMGRYWWGAGDREAVEEGVMELLRSSNGFAETAGCQ